jgi:nitrogen fixation protein NifB
VRHVLCAKIGDCPKGVLEAAGIAASDAYAYEYAETAIGALYAQTFARAQDRAAA